MNLFYLAIALTSLSATGLLRKYTLKKGILDIPNARSSHAVPTPRGGGLAIVVSMLGAMTWLGIEHGFSRPIVALGVAGVVVAITGFIDDRAHVRVRWRLLVHFACAGLVVWGWGGLPPLQLFAWHVDLGIAGHLLAVVGVVWMLNLYNFMDGIDGIAGTETVTSAAIAGVLLWMASAPPWLVSLNWGLAAATLGFLIWNFPPAKIFMGDAGSGFLGLMAGALGLGAAHHAPEFLWAWLILLGVFIVDATMTLVRRALEGARPHEAHQAHAYQVASRKYGRHLPITIAVMFINLLWLSPLAYAVTTGRLHGVVGIVIAYVPLLVLAHAFKAGRTKHMESTN